MIEVKNLSFGFADKELYKKISFVIEEGQHCVLIGSNGTGKTTLVEMIMDKEKHLYDGKIVKQNGCKIAIMNQFAEKDKNLNLTVMDYLSEEFLALLQKQEDLCAKMAVEENLDDIFEEYQKVLDIFQSVDGDNYESNIKKELKLAGLEHCEMLELEKLSGGEYKLVQIIKEMMKNPDLFIMDEPDVFLDFDNLNGLVKLINSYKGTVLVITHNRYLLNHCFNKVLHLENADIQEFDGSFTEYRCALLSKKVELYELAKEDIDEIERNRAVVEKLRAEATYIDNAAKGRQLKARVSYLARLEARQIKAPFIEAGCEDFDFKYADDNQRVDNQDINNQDVENSENIPEEIINVSNYNLAYENELLKNVSFTVKKGEKLAIVGPNGTGKTTLLNDIYKSYNEMDNDSISWKSDVSAGFLSQLHMDEMGDKLSGGEKNIRCLKKIADTENDILLLDEPTSHLDTYAQIALERAIKRYKGSVLMVSHDFYLIANCMDAVLLVEDNSIRRMSIRAFRKMIYEKYFDKDYLEMEKKRNDLELMVENSIKSSDVDKAKHYLDSLLEII